MPNEMNTLHIVKDNHLTSMPVEEIFDTKKYDTFCGVTYSVTPTFINKYLSEFETLELVVGIPEERVKIGANIAAKTIKAKIESLLHDEPVQLYQQLSTDVKTKLSERRVTILVPLAHVIHAKFYLLSNSHTKDTRLIMGSANLSEQAFLPTSNQFETIMIIDNHPLFDVYQSYFADELNPVLTNYMPSELLRINTKKLKELHNESEKEIDAVIMLDNSDVERVQAKGILETFEETEFKASQHILPETTTEEMRNIYDARQQETKQERKDRKVEETAYTIVKESISPRSKEPVIRSTASLNKIIKNKIQIKITKNEDTGLPERPITVSSPEQRSLNKNVSGLFRPSSSDKDRLLPFGKIASQEDIKASLELLHRFVQTFEKYTIRYDETYGARVIEAILYAFTAPFIIEIKQRARSEEERHDIPQFLFLGGAAGSGKSSLLKMIAKMIQLPSAIDYHSIVGNQVHHHKKRRIDALDMWLNESNVSPLLIDEIPEDFFTNPTYGNELIVNTSNRLAYDLKPCPVLIGTTNSEGYTLEERARRRSYYLKLDKIFDDVSRQHSPTVYLKIYNKMNSTLFQDFVLRLAGKLTDDSLTWAHFENNGKIDFLFHTREVFKDYYDMANMPLPRYFPETRYDDSKETNQEKWRKLFLGTSQNEFKFDTVSGNLLFKVATLDENTSRYGSGKPSDIYKNALSQKVIIGSKDGTDIELDTPLFFEWINISNPFITHYQNHFKKIYINNPQLFEHDKKTQTIYIDLDTVINTKNQTIVERYLYYIPQKMVVHRLNNQLELDAKSFCHWIDVPYHIPILARLFPSNFNKK